jgi:hypothetical protein
VPNVPQVPGVPTLSSYSTGAAVTVLVADAVSILSSFFGPQWGIFQNGVAVVEADNVVSMEYKQDWSISDYPVEQGAFESYDRVLLPFEARVRFSSGGDFVNRELLLSSIQAITQGTQVFDVVTPEQVYPSVSISHYDYRRTAQSGVGLMQVDVWCTQIRVTTSPQFTNTQSPSGASPVGGGSVQTGFPTAAQQNSLTQVH